MLLLLFFFGALLEGDWWAWLIVVILAAAIGIAIYAGIRAPTGGATGSMNPYGDFIRACEQGDVDELQQAVAAADAFSPLGASQWRTAGEAYEARGATMLAIDAYRKALIRNPKVGVKQALQRLEKRL